VSAHVWPLPAATALIGGLTAGGDDVGGGVVTGGDDVEYGVAVGSDGAGGPDVGGVVIWAGLVADAQAKTRRPTPIVVATRDSEERIRRQLGSSGCIGQSEKE
jgi:hypothetical protein